MMLAGQRMRRLLRRLRFSSSSSSSSSDSEDDESATFERSGATWSAANLANRIYQVTSDESDYYVDFYVPPQSTVLNVIVPQTSEFPQEVPDFNIARRQTIVQIGLYIPPQQPVATAAAGNDAATQTAPRPPSCGPSAAGTEAATGRNGSSTSTVRTKIYIVTVPMWSFEFVRSEATLGQVIEAIFNPNADESLIHLTLGQRPVRYLSSNRNRVGSEVSSDGPAATAVTTAAAANTRFPANIFLDRTLLRRATSSSIVRRYSSARNAVPLNDIITLRESRLRRRNSRYSNCFAG